MEFPDKDGGKVIQVEMEADHQRYKCESRCKKIRDPRVSKGRQYPIRQEA